MKRGTEYAANGWVTHSKVARMFIDRIDHLEMHSLAVAARSALREAYLAGVLRAKKELYGKKENK